MILLLNQYKADRHLTFVRKRALCYNYNIYNYVKMESIETVFTEYQEAHDMESNKAVPNN